MTRTAFAPWAEAVDDPAPHLENTRCGTPGALLTADDLFDLSGRAEPAVDPRVYELVEGRLVRTMPAAANHGDIASELDFALRGFVKFHRLGRVSAAETGFIVSPPDQPDTVLAADVAFVRQDRLPTRNTPEA